MTPENSPNPSPKDPIDPRPDWKKEDQELEGRKPDLNEIEEDTIDL